MAESAVRSHFRCIMKHLSRLPSSQTPAAVAKRNNVRLRFLKGAKETDAAKVEGLRENAKLYATLVSSVNELKFLRELDTGDKLDPRQHINATASRVGFSLPAYADQVDDFTGDLPEPKIVPSRFGPDVHFGQQLDTAKK